MAKYSERLIRRAFWVATVSFTAMALLVMPIVILYVLVKLLPPWGEPKAG